MRGTCSLWLVGVWRRNRCRCTCRYSEADLQDTILKDSAIFKIPYSKMREKSRGPLCESEKYKRIGNNDFVRVLFWQFHNFRMLLGGDLLMFSNEKYVAVNLHLWDVARQSWLSVTIGMELSKVTSCSKQMTYVFSRAYLMMEVLHFIHKLSNKMVFPS